MVVAWHARSDIEALGVQQLVLGVWTQAIHVWHGGIKSSPTKSCRSSIGGGGDHDRRNRR